MRVLFVDVGQGTCQIILTGKRRAIVIDAGASPSTALRTLRLLKIETIELLVISHSHIDHSGGAAHRTRHRLLDDRVTGVLVDYQDAIDRVAYVFDSQFQKRPVGKYLVKLVQDQKLKREQLVPFVATDKPYPLWNSDDGSTTLAAISPLGGDHLVAFDCDKPNASSAILELRHQGNKIVFAADSEFEQWREVYRLRGNQTLLCKALTMPHHGGLMHGSSEDLTWFCNDAVNAEVVVVSVATINRHGHPREEVIRAVAASGSHVMCTQITEKCCQHLESLRFRTIDQPGPVSRRGGCTPRYRAAKLPEDTWRECHVHARYLLGLPTTRRCSTDSRAEFHRPENRPATRRRPANTKPKFCRFSTRAAESQDVRSVR